MELSTEMPYIWKCSKSRTVFRDASNQIFLSLVWEDLLCPQGWKNVWKFWKFWDFFEKLWNLLKFWIFFLNLEIFEKFRNCFKCLKLFKFENKSDVAGIQKPMRTSPPPYNTSDDLSLPSPNILSHDSLSDLSNPMTTKTKKRPVASAQNIFC